MENKYVNLLLIDDDEVSNMINTKLISKNFQYRVTTYTNGLECLADLRKWYVQSPENLPDAIFLDINMPQMDGWEFLEEFEKLPDGVLGKTNVVMLTSSIDTDDIERSRKYPSVKEFISKPLTIEKLRMLIIKISLTSGTK